MSKCQSHVTDQYVTAIARHLRLYTRSPHVSIFQSASGPRRRFNSSRCTRGSLPMALADRRLARRAAARRGHSLAYCCQVVRLALRRDSLLLRSSGPHSGDLGEKCWLLGLTSPFKYFTFYAHGGRVHSSVSAPAGVGALFSSLSPGKLLL